MIDYSRRGHRVQIKPGVRTFYRAFKGHETGTILCEIENGVGNRLLEVEWDGLGQSPVFPNEVDEIPQRGGGE